MWVFSAVNATTIWAGYSYIRKYVKKNDGEQQKYRTMTELEITLLNKKIEDSNERNISV